MIPTVIESKVQSGGGPGKFFVLRVSLSTMQARDPVFC